MNLCWCNQSKFHYWIFWQFSTLGWQDLYWPDLFNIHPLVFILFCKQHTSVYLRIIRQIVSSPSKTCSIRGVGRVTPWEVILVFFFFFFLLGMCFLYPCVFAVVSPCSIFNNMFLLLFKNERLIPSIWSWLMVPLPNSVKVKLSFLQISFVN